jgi:hypothetical protein
LAQLRERLVDGFALTLRQLVAMFTDQLLQAGG